MRGRSRWWSLLALCGACTAAPTDPAAGALVRLTDSVVIEDRDTFPRSPFAAGSARTRDGHLFVEVEDRVLHFDPQGRFVRAIGRPGDGPGELRRISGPQLLPGDSLLAVVSAAGNRIVVFRVADGTAAAEIPVADVLHAGQHWVARGDTMLIPALFDRRPYRRWVPGDSVRVWGRAPRALDARLGMAYQMGGLVALAARSSGYLALSPADSAVVVLRDDGSVRGYVDVPRRLRRALPADAEARYQTMLDESPPRLELLAPMTMGLHRRPGGGYIVVHFDGVAELLGDLEGFAYHDTVYWVTLLSEDLARACVDGRLPAAPEDLVRPLFVGDTIVLYVRGEDPSGQPQGVLRRYLVSDDGCAWQPTGGVRTP